MLTILYVALMVLIFCYFGCWYTCYERANDLFNVTTCLRLETIILFSHEELAKRTMKIIKRTNKPLKIQVADDEYLSIPNNLSKEELLAKMDVLQSLMIHKRYCGENEAIVKEAVNRHLFDIWLDYGDKQNYRTILKREMLRLLDSEEISNSTYNEMYRRAFRFKRDK